MESHVNRRIRDKAMVFGLPANRFMVCLAAMCAPVMVVLFRPILFDASAMPENSYIRREEKRYAAGRLQTVDTSYLFVVFTGFRSARDTRHANPFVALSHRKIKTEDAAYRAFVAAVDSMYRQLDGSGALAIEPMSGREIRDYAQYWFNGFQSDFLTDAAASESFIRVGDRFVGAVSIERERSEYAYYVAVDGEVIPAHYAARRDNIEIEIRHHLTMFVDDWYTLTQYDWEEKAERAGWLGGNSIRDLFIARKKAGYYNRFIQNNIAQSARIVDLQVHPEADGTYSFELAVDIQERMDAYVRMWRLLAGGAVRVIERSWPHNPHGLWIEPYLETKIMEVRTNE